MAWLCFLMIYLTWQNLAREKWRHKVAKILHSFVFILIWKLGFMSRGSQPRIYADLLRIQSREKYHTHIIILMKSLIPIPHEKFFHSFFSCPYTSSWVKKNQRIIRNIFGKYLLIPLYRHMRHLIFDFILHLKNIQIIKKWTTQNYLK